MKLRKFWKEAGPFDLLGCGFPFYKDVWVGRFYRNRHTRKLMKIYRRRQERRETSSSRESG